MPGPVRDKREPFQQLESILLRQMLQSSGAFKAGSTPGAQLRTDMFVETLADAVAKAGGLGIARMLERQLGGTAGTAGAREDAGSAAAHASAIAPPRSAFSPLSAGHSPIPVSLTATSLDREGRSPTLSHIDLGVGDLDRLEDPNNDAPLPEDPSAGSIDDYQRRPSAQQAISRGRGLNGYRRRAEAKVAGTSFGASSGEEP